MAGNNLWFPGQYYDSETGLHYNWHRYYDPEIGRYLRTDPLGLDAGVNLYAYVNNNPLGFVDPEGLEVRVNSRWLDLSEPVRDFVGDFGAHTYVEVRLNGVTTSLGSYRSEDGKNEILPNNVLDWGPDALPTTSSIVVSPPEGMNSTQWAQTVLDTGMNMYRLPSDDYALFGGRSELEGNCHVTTREILTNAGGSVPAGYNPPGLNPGLTPPHNSDYLDFNMAP